MKFKAKASLSSKIPTASIADIVFLLLIFFMTITVFRRYTGLRVTLPAAKATQKIEARRSICYIWIDKSHTICIDDVDVNMNELGALVRAKLADNRALIISLRVDKEVDYRYVAETLEALKEANALRINFGTLTEGRPEL